MSSGTLRTLAGTTAPGMSEGLNAEDEDGDQRWSVLFVTKTAHGSLHRVTTSDQACLVCLLEAFRLLRLLL